MTEQQHLERFELVSNQAEKMAYKVYQSNSRRIDLEDLKQQALLCAWNCTLAYEDKPELDFKKLTFRSISHELAHLCEKETQLWNSTTGFEYSAETDSCWEAEDTRALTEDIVQTSYTLSEVEEFLKDDYNSTRVLKEILSPSKETISNIKKNDVDITPKAISKSLGIDLDDVKESVNKVRTATHLALSNNLNSENFSQLVVSKKFFPEEVNWTSLSTLAIVTVAMGLGLNFRRSSDERIERMWAINALKKRGVTPFHKYFSKMK